jgi:hypothetical protein
VVKRELARLLSDVRQRESSPIAVR